MSRLVWQQHGGQEKKRNSTHSMENDSWFHGSTSDGKRNGHLLSLCMRAGNDRVGGKKSDSEDRGGFYGKGDNGMGIVTEPSHPGLRNSRDDNLAWLDRRIINTQDYALLNVPFRRRAE
jgi:hypothetical protein